jgi:transcriptional repressor NrdR
MRCPYCKTDNDRVVDSRSATEGAVIRRRRECLGCGKRFTTYERVEEQPLRVVKKDGSRVEYNRDKILAGLRRACEKRPVTLEQLENLVLSVEEEVNKRFDREVESSFIGEEVMRRLASLDQVAYVRFASVYRQFRDASDFAREIEALLKPRKPQRGKVK